MYIVLRNSYSLLLFLYDEAVYSWQNHKHQVMADLQFYTELGNAEWKFKYKKYKHSSNRDKYT